MELQNADTMALEAQIALAHTPPILREPLRIFFELDGRLARIVAATSEPMLGQMRLAWWRDTLGKPVDERPSGDFVLDAIGQHWAGHEHALVRLVDGWEEMLAEQLDQSAAIRFGEGRGAAFAALAEIAGVEASTAVPAERWALTDAAVHIPDGDERDMLIALANAKTDQSALAKPLRGLAVLDALSRRSLKNGGRPLMEGRGASIVATRAAIFGR